MNRVLAAFGRAVASQMHPRMLALLLLPFGVSLVFWGLVAWLAWDPVLDWLRERLTASDGVLHDIYVRARTYGLDALGGLAGLVVALVIWVPLMFVTALLVIAVLAMPVVTRHLGDGAYRGLQRRGSWSVLASLWNAVSSAVVFLLMYVASLPLWLVPPLGFIVPWLCWSWLAARVMRFDSLVEHADDDERRATIAAHRRGYFALAATVSVLNYVPPLFLVTPVLSALAFSHYSLGLLRERRAAAGTPGAALPGNLERDADRTSNRLEAP